MGVGLMPGRSMRGGIGVLAAVVVLAGCTDDLGDEDPAPEGMATYACALVDEIDKPVEDWDITPGGPDVDTDVIFAHAAATLVGGRTATPLEGYDELHEPAQTLTAGFQRDEPGVIETGLDDLTAACDEADLALSNADTSSDGRLDYACNLIIDIDEADQSVEDWAPAEEQTPSPDTALETEALGAASLLGGSLRWQIPDHEDLSDAAYDLLVGLRLSDTDRSAEALDELSDDCHDR